MLLDQLRRGNISFMKEEKTQHIKVNFIFFRCPSTQLLDEKNGMSFNVK